MLTAWILLPALLFAASAPPVNPLDAADLYAGEFNGPKLELRLESKNGSYSGSLVFNGQTYPVRGSVVGDRWVGRFTSQGTEFELTARRSGPVLTLETGGAVYRLTEKRTAPPPATNPLSTPPAPSAPPTSTPSHPPAVSSAAALQSLRGLSPQPDPEREWTILIYLDGDNDLETFALRDLNELEAGLPAGKVEILALVDRAEGYDDSDGDWTDARLYRIRPDSEPTRVTSPILAQLGEVNTGDPALLEAFVAGALRAYPARRTALVMWDHGGGWAQMASDHSVPGSEAHGYLTLPKMRQALERGLRESGVAKLDLIGFDMCLMAQIETAFELEGLAEIMVASQAVEPGDGWPYHAILPVLARGPLGPRRVAQEIVEAYHAFYRERGAISTTLSAVDLSLVGEVVQKLDRVVAALDEDLARSWPDLGRSLFFAESYANRADIRNGEQALASADLSDALHRIRASSAKFPADVPYRELLSLLDRFVITSRTSLLRSFSNGVAIYAPAMTGTFNSGYLETRFGRESKWAGLVQRVHAQQRSNATAPVIGDVRLVRFDNDQPATAARFGGGDGVRFSVTGNNILWTLAQAGFRDADAGGVVVTEKWLVIDPEYAVKILSGEKKLSSDPLEVRMPTYVNGRNELRHEIRGFRYAVTNNQDGAYYATVDHSILEGVDYYRVPIIFEHPSVGRLGGTILFDSGWWSAAAVILELPQEDGRMLFRQIDPPADARITPLFEVIPDQGEATYVASGTVTWNEGLELLLGEMPSGEHTLVITAESMGAAPVTRRVPYRMIEKRPEERQMLERAQFKGPDIVGTWRWNVLENGQLRPLPNDMVSEFVPNPENEAFVTAKTTWKNKDGSAGEERAVVFIDMRLNPITKWCAVVNGELSSIVTTYESLLQRDTQRLFLKGYDHGMLVVLTRERGGEAVAANPKGAPPKGLAGVWQNPQLGIGLAMSEDQWEFYEGGELGDMGSYRATADRIVATSVSGERTVYRYRLDGDRLTLVDEDGATYVLGRVRR